MKLLLVTQKTRAGSDAVSTRETLLDGERIHVGRAVSMEVNLPDIEIDYHHATLTQTGGRLKMTAETPGGLKIGRKSVDEADLTGGDVVTIGRFTFKGEPGRDGADAVLVMHEAPADATASAKPESARTLEDVLPSRRLLGWVFSLAILGVFLIWPLTDVLQRPGMQPDAAATEVMVVDGMARADLPHPTPMEASWTSGEISNAHKLLADDCAACHEQAFVRVQDNACLACHATLENHADPAAHPAVAQGAIRCASCHLEHESGEGPTALGPYRCGDCHEQMQAVSPDSELDNVSSFASDHPVFQLAVITDVRANPGARPEAVVTRTRFDPEQPPRENAGLKFPHNKHLVAGGVRAPAGRVELGCADCHQLEPGGMLMRPIAFDRDCSNCHLMEFDAAGVTRPLPHAEEDEIARVINDYFLAAAMEGGVTAQSAPAAVQRTRRRRITLEELEQEQAETQEALSQLSDQVRGQTIEWAQKETLVQMDQLFGVRLCGTCHEAQKFPEKEGVDRWQVLPAVLQRHWMPKARFNHEPHLAMECTGCHAATTSGDSRDVLMPAMDGCRDCHNASAQTAGIECMSCHEYHVTGRTPMSPAHADTFRLRAAVKQRAQATGGQAAAGQTTGGQTTGGQTTGGQTTAAQTTGGEGQTQ